MPSPSTISASSFRERVGALRNLRPFLAMVWATSPTLTAAIIALRLMRALLPVATLYIGKLIIDEVVMLVQLPDKPATLQPAGQRPCSTGSWLLLAPSSAWRCWPTCWAACRLAGRRAAGGAGQHQLERAPDGACRDARPRGLRGQRVRRTSSNARAARPAAA
jgi:hypothetical protein